MRGGYQEDDVKRWMPVVALASLVVVGCSDREEIAERRKQEAGGSEEVGARSGETAAAVTNAPVRRTCAAVKAAARGIYRLESVVRDPPPRFVSLDVEGMSADELKAKFAEVEHPEATRLWMPGAKSWILVERSSPATIGLAAAMDAFADDAECTISPTDVFAGYVGTLADIMPAFDAALAGEVVPEWFVTREIPEIGWLDYTDIDDDIAKTVREDIHKVQSVRRLVLAGNIASKTVASREDESVAVERWASAYVQNPNDSLLLERLDVLDRNARGFLEVGKLLQAMKCFETIVLVNPNDAAAIHNVGICLKKIGRLDMAEKVLKHADEVLRRREAGE